MPPRSIRAFAAALLLAACTPGAPTPPAAEEGSATPPIPVEYVGVGVAEMTRTVRATTTVRSAETRLVQAGIAGVLRGWTLRVGDRVEAAARLALIEADIAEDAVRDAERAVDRARRMRDEVAPLVDQGFLARQTLDEAAATLDDAQAALDTARRSLADAAVVAPVGGVATEVLASAGERVAPGQALARIATDDQLEVVAAIPERDAAAVAVGQIARIDSDARSWTGRVTRIAPVVDARTGTLDVTIAPDATEGLRAGAFVTASIVVEVRPEARVVPRRALLWEADEASVFVATPDGEGSGEGSGEVPTATVDRVTVVPGFEDARRIEVAAGPDAGVLIVVTGQTGLEPGDRVALVTQRADLLSTEGSGAEPR